MIPNQPTGSQTLRNNEGTSLIGLNNLLAPERVRLQPIDRIAYASDASCYRLIPEAVVQPENIGEVVSLFNYSHQHRIPLAFRAAGTSLSGQSITDGILVDISKHWRKIQIEQEDELIRLGPGVIGSDANAALKPFGRRIGPDPASIDAAMLGGMVATNASGMCCGVVENSYHTMESLVFVLPNGLVIDTSDPLAEEKFEQYGQEIFEGLQEIKREILSSQDLTQRIRSKYRSKNTIGYSLNAFLDYERPIDILAHLMVGSEGTLGFIGEIVLRTFPVPAYKYTGMLIFETVEAACEAVVPFSRSGARVIEFMDRASLRSVENEVQIIKGLQELPEGASALLVEYQVNALQDVEDAKRRSLDVINSIKSSIISDHFTSDTDQQAILWKIRKGLYPSIGGMRAKGTTVLIEDVAVPVNQLAMATLDLQALFAKHNYPEAIIYGHAKDGNLHFVLTPSFNDAASIIRYSNFIDDVVDLVIKKYDGALKAEHGTGRNMAPFVEEEWGNLAYRLMKRLKELIDPTGLLNPGVIINDDPTAHLQNFKPWPIVEEEVDKCIECGFCEPKCPSRDLTLTPRQRIVVRREITRLTESGENPVLLASLLADYQYAGLETCAADGYCALACPIHINTGDLIKRLRAEGLSPTAQNAASKVVQHFALIENVLRAGVSLGHAAEKIIGAKGVTGGIHLIERLSKTTLPKWNAVVPRANYAGLPKRPKTEAGVVYFPSCIARTMGTSPMKSDMSLPGVMAELCRRAGFEAWIPSDSAGNCCGMPFSSKGYQKAFQEMLKQTINHFWAWSEEGCLPIVIDSSSCAYTLLNAKKWVLPEDRDKYDQLTIMDPVDFVYTRLLPQLNINRLRKSIVLHPNCSLVKLGKADKLVNVAQACADQVTIPYNLKCCGFAGDRGLLYPELTQSASHLEASEIKKHEYDGYYSSNLTCEMGMSLATGKPYRSILYLVEEASSE